MFDHKSPEMRLNATATALVFTDLHNDFLSPQGKAFHLPHLSINCSACRLSLGFESAPA